MIASDHIANGIDLHIVKAAFAHPVRDALRTGAVSVGEVGDRQLALVGIAGVRMRGQALLPVPDIIAQLRGDAKFVVQANLDNAVNISQALLQLKVGMAGEAALESVEYLLLA